MASTMSRILARNPIPGIHVSSRVYEVKCLFEGAADARGVVGTPRIGGCDDAVCSGLRRKWLPSEPCDGVPVTGKRFA